MNAKLFLFYLRIKPFLKCDRASAALRGLPNGSAKQRETAAKADRGYSLDYLKKVIKRNRNN